MAYFLFLKFGLDNVSVSVSGSLAKVMQVSKLLESQEHSSVVEHLLSMREGLGWSLSTEGKRQVLSAFAISDTKAICPCEFYINDAI